MRLGDRLEKSEGNLFSQKGGLHIGVWDLSDIEGGLYQISFMDPLNLTSLLLWS